MAGFEVTTEDREKLMAVTRSFAHDHDLFLPDGYDRRGPGHDRQPQLSQYEKIQQDRTGLTREQRISEATEAWNESGDARGFVGALDKRGYILATGKRPYILIDRYGGMSALPKLIADKQVTTKALRAFLAKDFPPESLPSVEEALQRAAARRKPQEDFAEAQRPEDLVVELQAKQATRRAPLQKDSATLKARHAAEELRLSSLHQNALQHADQAFHCQMQQLQHARDSHRATGLAAFLGRVTGFDLVIRALRHRCDQSRQRQYLEQRTELKSRQSTERSELNARHRMQRFDMARRLRSLRKIDRHELRSLEDEHHRASRRQRDSNEEAGDQHHDTYIDLLTVFDRAAGVGAEGEGDAGGETGSGSPTFKSPFHRPGPRKGTDR